jgi:hypothetical protein
MVHSFYAMASDCAVHLCGENASKVERVSTARSVLPDHFDGQLRIQRDNMLKANYARRAMFSKIRLAKVDAGESIRHEHRSLAGAPCPAKSSISQLWDMNACAGRGWRSVISIKGRVA